MWTIGGFELYIRKRTFLCGKNTAQRHNCYVAPKSGRRYQLVGGMGFVTLLLRHAESDNLGLTLPGVFLDRMSKSPSFPGMVLLVQTKTNRVDDGGSSAKILYCRRDTEPRNVTTTCGPQSWDWNNLVEGVAPFLCSMARQVWLSWVNSCWSSLQSPESSLSFHGRSC